MSSTVPSSQYLPEMFFSFLTSLVIVHATCMPGALSPGVKRQLELVFRSRNRELCIHSDICFFDVVFNQLSTGTTLPFYNIVHLHPVAHCYYSFIFFFRLCATCQCLKHFIVFSTVVTF
jgi:hypothetical protein